MSYDIYLNPPAVETPCATCGRSGGGGEPERLNPTYNLGGIFCLALTPVLCGTERGDGARGVRSLHGRKARDTVTELREGVTRIENPAMRDAFEALEPENGWGTLSGARKVLRQMLANAEQYPDNTWEVR